MNELRPGQLKILKAVAVLLENPSAKVTIANIAKQIHLTEGAIYRHYTSKEAIFEALMGYMESNLLGPLNAVQQQTAATPRRLEVVFMRYMEFLEGHPGLARLVLGHGATEAPGLSERIKMLNAKIRTQVLQMLRFGQANNDLSPTITPEQAVEIYYGLFVAASMAQAFAFPVIPAAERWGVFARIALKGSGSAAAA